MASPSLSLGGNSLPTTYNGPARTGGFQISPLMAAGAVAAPFALATLPLDALGGTGATVAAGKVAGALSSSGGQNVINSPVIPGTPGQFSAGSNSIGHAGVSGGGGGGSAGGGTGYSTGTGYGATGAYGSGGGAVSVGPSAAQQAYIGNSLNDIFSNARNSAAQSSYGYSAYAEPLLSSIAQQQTSINQGRENNALQNYQSMVNIANALRQGLYSGGVQLAARGAAASSAAPEMARLMNQQAAAQSMGANLQRDVTNRQLDQQQQELGTLTQDTLQKIHSFRDASIAQIQSEMQSRLDSLNNLAAQYGMAAPDESQRDAIINDAVNKLAGVDQFINQQVAGYQPEDYGAAQGAMRGLMNKGALPAVPTSDQYSFQPTGVNGTPLSSGTGALLSNLPLFLKNNNQ